MTAKTERLNLRCSADAMDILREAARVQGQDLTSFMMGASLDRARQILAEDRMLHLTPAEVIQLEQALDAEGGSSPQLAALVRSVRAAQRTH